MKSTTAILGLLPKACWRGSLALMLLGAGGAGASAQYLYLDATSGVSGNTTLADGSLFNPPLNATTGADNNWEQRTTFGSSGNIFESGGEIGMAVARRRIGTCALVLPRTRGLIRSSPIPPMWPTCRVRLR